MPNEKLDQLNDLRDHLREVEEENREALLREPSIAIPLHEAREKCDRLYRKVSEGVSNGEENSQ